MQPTPTQQRLIDAITGVLEAEPQVQGAWLSGSLGRGEGDAFSDVDVLVLADGDAGELAMAFRSRVDAVADTVLVLLHFGRVLTCVTREWDRFDLAFVTAPELARHDARQLACLFSRGAQPEARDLPSGPPGNLAANVLEFFRVLGLAHVGVGRQEPVVMLEGIGHLRRILVETMLERNGVGAAARGGVLKLNPYLTGEQRAALSALPPLEMTVDSLLSGSVALARIFVPLAKAMSAERAHPWPEALEAAARRCIQRIPDVVPPTLW